MEKWQSDHMINELASFGSMKKKFEMSVVVPIIMNEDLTEVRPVLQQHVKREPSKKDAYIDLYYPELDLAIEIDEEYHDNRQDEDEEREDEIMNAINCEIKRFDAKSTTFNIGKTIEDITGLVKSKIQEKKDFDTFQLWEEPEIKRLDELRNELDSTLFVKTKIEHGKLTIPYGPISEEVRGKTDRVILYNRASEVQGSFYAYTEFKDVYFLQSEDDQSNYSPTGSTVTHSQYLDTYATEWDVPRTFILSNDLLKNRKNYRK